MSLKAKYRLHAKMVDRIAIVDKPAVPDAQIVVYKNLKDDSTTKEKGIGVDLATDPSPVANPTTSFQSAMLFNVVYAATQSAVDSLRSYVFEVLYWIKGEEQDKKINESFSVFSSLITSLLAQNMVTSKSFAKSKRAKQDVVDDFARSLSMNTISDLFENFKRSFPFTITCADEFEDPQATVDSIIALLKQRVIDELAKIPIEKMDKGLAIEKIGRVISAERLTKIKGAMDALKKVIDEAEGYMKKNPKEVEGMDFKQEHLDAISKTSADVQSIVKALKDAGLMLTEAEKAEIVQKNADAEKKVALTKRATSVGLKGDETEEVIAKKEADVAAEKSKKEADALIEKKKKDDDAIAVEKKAKEDAEARLAKIEKSLGTMDDFIALVSAKFGIKKSLDAGTAGKADNDNEGDVFGDTLRKRKSN